MTWTNQTKPEVIHTHNNIKIILNNISPVSLILKRRTFMNSMLRTINPADIDIPHSQIPKGW